MQRLVRGRVAENGSLFYPSGFVMVPFFFKVIFISGAYFILAFTKMVEFVQFTDWRGNIKFDFNMSSKFGLWFCYLVVVNFQMQWKWFL